MSALSETRKWSTTPTNLPERIFVLAPRRAAPPAGGASGCEAAAISSATTSFAVFIMDET